MGSSFVDDDYRYYSDEEFEYDPQLGHGREPLGRKHKGLHFNPFTGRYGKEDYRGVAGPFRPLGIYDKGKKWNNEAGMYVDPMQTPQPRYDAPQTSGLADSITNGLGTLGQQFLGMPKMHGQSESDCQQNQMLFQQ